jgi:hypothetical protein
MDSPLDAPRNQHRPGAGLVRRLRAPILCVLLASLGACAGLRPASVPLRTLAAPARCSGAVDTLIVMLPGNYSLPEEFEQESFVRILREGRIASDVLMVDAHFAYYKNRSIADRLHADVLMPARQRGYRSIWLVGISLGAAGSMLYADAWPGDVGGIVMLGPYLGERQTAEQIRNAGGLAAWPAPERAKDDVDSMLWRWLKSQAGPADGSPRPSIYLGYGLDDRFAYNQQLLGESLPAAHVFTAPGGHDWTAWTPLWRRIVDQLPLPHDASCAAS